MESAHQARLPFFFLFSQNGGTSPAISECHQAVAGVLRRIREEAELAGLDLDVSATTATHGLKSAVVVLHGAGACAFADRWCGAIRWRAKSTLRPYHKRANWFVGVFILAKGATKVAGILGLWRVGYRIKQGFASPASSLPAWQETASKISHIVLLSSVVLMPFSGLVIALYSGFPTDVFGIFMIPAIDKVDAIAGTARMAHKYIA